MMDQDKYLPELLAEKESLDPSFVHAMRLLAEGKLCFLGWRLFGMVTLLYSVGVGHVWYRWTPVLEPCTNESSVSFMFSGGHLFSKIIVHRRSL